MENSLTIKTTRSICSVCYEEIVAFIRHKDGKIILEKHCPEHGIFDVVLSLDPEYFSELLEAYFTLMPLNMPCRILDATLTPTCELKCPICCVSNSIGRVAKPMDVEDIERIIRENPQKKEFLLGHMEPTENPHIEEILKCLSKHKINGFLFTNGLKFTNMEFLKKLKNAGLGYVYLQFDGFNDEVFKVLRGRNLLQEKLKILENLKELDIPTTLNVTLALGVNESEINKIIDYAVNNDFIRQIGILPLVRLGSADKYRKECSPQCNEALRILVKETKGRINLNNLKVFQKLMYVVYRFNKFRRCFWFTAFVLIKDKKNDTYRTLDEYVDFYSLEKAIDLYIEEIKTKANIASDLKLLFRLAGIFLRPKTIPIALTYIKFLLGKKSIGSARSNSGLLFITSTDFCDFYKMDLDMADKYCEELLAFKNKENKIVYNHTYKILIEESRSLSKQSQ